MVACANSETPSFGLGSQCLDLVVLSLGTLRFWPILNALGMAGFQPRNYASCRTVLWSSKFRPGKQGCDMVFRSQRLLGNYQ